MTDNKDENKPEEKSSRNSLDFYTGERQVPASGLRFPPQSFAKNNPANYWPSSGLKEAVNLAILMQQPLLLTGDPGTGKTRLAYHVAWELGLDEPLKFETRSTSQARDLFYYYNAMGLFQSQHNTKASKDPVDYITYNALGTAIIRSNDPNSKELEGLLPKAAKHIRQEKSIVLIDEIDKAQSDFPNDILNQIEDLYFRIPELENRIVKADPAFVPITIITSNSEKNLPKAFLRRCIFFHIEYPTPKDLKRIAETRLIDILGAKAAATGNDVFMTQGLQVFERIRAESTIKKKPATAEFIAWLAALKKYSIKANPFDDEEQVLKSLGVMIKEHDDIETAKTLVKETLYS